MAVKIEILDYKYASGDNLVDCNLGNDGAIGTWTINSPTSVSWDSTGVTNGVNGFFSNITSEDLVAGLNYELSFTISNSSGNTSMGFGSSGMGIPNTARIIGNGSVSIIFSPTLSTKPDLLGRFNNSGTISNISIKLAEKVDWDNSIVGELDVTDNYDFPLSLTFQITDFKKITSTSGDYSNTFKLPASKNNNNLLKNIYIPNIENVNNVTEKKPCRILIDNLYSLVGLLQVDGVTGYGETPSYYNCVFFGNNLGWANILTNSLLKDINWGSSAEGLTYNKNSIKATWSDLDCNSSTSSIVYPLTSYGEYNPGGIEQTVQLLETRGEYIGQPGLGGYYGYTDAGVDYGNPLPSADWRPAIFVKETIEKLFNQANYQISSVFMETDMFKKLVWALPNFKYNNPSQREIELSFGAHYDGEGFIETEANIPGNSTGNSPQDTDFNVNPASGTDFVLNTTTNNLGWDSATGQYTAPEYGYYEINLSNYGMCWQNTVLNNCNENMTFTLSVQVQTVDNTHWQNIATTVTNTLSYNALLIPTANSPLQGFHTLYFDEIKQRRWLNKGDKVQLSVRASYFNCGAGATKTQDVHFFGSQSITSTTTSNNAGAKMSIRIDPTTVEYGQTYDLDKVIDEDFKQIDFIKGIAHSFNLKMTTDESTKTVFIEPFDSFYKPYGQAIDWTHKVDRSKKTSDKFIESDLKRDIIFKYKTDDNDKTVAKRGENYFQGIEDEYPYKQTLPETFTKGTSEFENPFFAGTYNGRDITTVGVNGNADTASSGLLWTSISEPYNLPRPDKGHNFKPRLLYWNKYSVDSPIETPKKFEVQCWSGTTETVTSSTNVTAYDPQFNIFPQATMINKDRQGTLSTNLLTYSPNLAYGNTNIRVYDDATLTRGGVQISPGLYNVYYRNMINQLILSPQIRKIYVSLNTTDIADLAFDKLIYIDGCYWRINKVVGYKPNKNESTKVELFKWYPIGIFAAAAPNFGNSGTTENWDGSVDTNNDIGI
mgnify:FL=1